ncbi:alpha/beta fold hydrolase [Amycolatopsis sp. H20-H5]|uniref:alpha/beta fold hydrolase n=1 Tax=Amycolatopsis sp. H20-H5 TaxID=3046309 RepID=UPI002DBEAE39|nr:alpha/beta hydrolase [Amycolatopsis sp. H20-H5]MEC3979620.1 alpha/beta hydrolase [Amycolatopsis sp. H20-H5]
MTVKPSSVTVQDRGSPKHRAPAVPASGPVPFSAEGGSPDAAGTRVQERELVFDGLTYTCRIAQAGGSGTPMLILGGSEQNRLSWTRHEKRIVLDSPVVTVDLPGYGTADFLPARYGIDYLAAAARHLVDELGMERVALFGACFGGAIALRFAQHYPSLVERLMLSGMSTAITADYTAAMERWESMIALGDTQDIARELTERFMSPPGTGTVRKYAAVGRLVYQQVAGQSPDSLRKSAEHNRRLMRHEWYRPEPCPQVPALVVTGEHDTLTTPDMGRRVASVLPAAQFLTVLETDHLAPLERSADFADLMVRFLTDQPLAGLSYATAPEPFIGGQAVHSPVSQSRTTASLPGAAPL